MAGRKPLPTAIKKLKGTLQKCRTNPHEPQPAGDLVDPPEYMADGAKQAWRYAIESAPEHLLRRLDMSVLEVWSCAADLYRKAQIGIIKTGLLIKAPITGVPMQSPYRGKPLSEDQEISNKAKSRVRARVEHVFGHMQNSMGGIFIRTIGIARAKVGVTLMNLTYNLCRIEVLIRNKVIGIDRVGASKICRAA